MSNDPSKQLHSLPRLAAVLTISPDAARKAILALDIDESLAINDVGYYDGRAMKAIRKFFLDHPNLDAQWNAEFLADRLSESGPDSDDDQ